MRGFIQTISLTIKPEDVRIVAPLAKMIQDMFGRPQSEQSPEFTAVTDIKLVPENPDHHFFDQMLGKAGVIPVPLENFAVWVAKLRPMLQ